MPPKLALRLLSPTRSLLVRGPDDWAPQGGAFGVRRTTVAWSKGEKVVVERRHLGLDLVLAEGLLAWAPCEGILERVGLCYPDDQRFHSLWIRPDGFPGVLVKVLYCHPEPGGTLGAAAPMRIARAALLGRAENLALRYPDPDGPGPRKAIVNHLHLELWLSGVRVDPLDYLEAE